MGKLSIILSAALVIACWQGIVSIFEMPAFILPSPLRVLAALSGNAALIAHHAWVTFSEVMLGLIMGVVLGACTAVAFVASPVLRQLVRPVTVFSQALPVFALAPILTLWFGYGLLPKIMMALLIIYFPVMSAFFDGLTRMPRPMMDMAQVMGGTNGRILWYLRIPMALPSLASGVRLAAVYAPIGAIIGEWVGASNGLGYLMLLANGRAKIDLMFAAVLVLAVMTLLLYALVDRGCRYVLYRQV